MNRNSDQSLTRQLEALVSEGRNPRTVDIDLVPTLEMARIINAEDQGVALAVEKTLPQIAQAIDAIADAFGRGGRLIYIGAGTSGRLGVLDASECPPTFGVPASMVVGLIAGGTDAIAGAREAAEDDAGQGAADLAAIDLGADDVVVGIAVSGRTPYVLGALDEARQRGAVTIALTCNPDSAAAQRSDISIAPVVGPEVITGSTRLKSGTAQKLVLNMLSTGAMIRTGKTFGNLMVDIQPGNKKLVARAARIVSQATGGELNRAVELLAAAGGSVKVAIMMELSGVDAAIAQQRLDAAGGVLRKAIAG